MPGDCIEVSVKTWEVTAPDEDCEAAIRVFESWEPSSKMLELL